MPSSYYAPSGGHPPQTQLLTDRAVFTEAYAVIPKGTMRDIVTSFLPFWEKTRLWVLSRPLSGFDRAGQQGPRLLPLAMCRAASALRKPVLRS